MMIVFYRFIGYKINRLLIGLVIMVFAFGASAQDLRFGVKTGLNLSMLRASINRDLKYKPGAQVGFYIEAKFSDKIYFQPEILYSAQGAKRRYGITPSIKTGETNLNLHYFNLPLIAKYYLFPEFNIQFGPQLGVLLGAREIGTVNGIDYDENITRQFQTIDFSLITGVGFDATDRLNFGARFNYGISNISKNSSLFGGTYGNTVFCLYAGLSL